MSNDTKNELLNYIADLFGDSWDLPEQYFAEQVRAGIGLPGILSEGLGSLTNMRISDAQRTHIKALIDKNPGWLNEKFMGLLGKIQTFEDAYSPFDIIWLKIDDAELKQYAREKGGITPAEYATAKYISEKVEDLSYALLSRYWADAAESFLNKNGFKVTKPVYDIKKDVYFQMNYEYLPDGEAEYRRRFCDRYPFSDAEFQSGLEQIRKIVTEDRTNKWKGLVETEFKKHGITVVITNQIERG